MCGCACAAGRAPQLKRKSAINAAPLVVDDECSVSPITPWTGLLGLLFILVVSAVREGWEDVVRTRTRSMSVLCGALARVVWGCSYGYDGKTLHVCLSCDTGPTRK